MKTSAVSVAAMAMLLAFLLAMPQVAMAAGSTPDTLIVGVQNDTPNLRPWDIATNSVWKSFLWRQWVYEGLYGLSPDGTIYPILAQSLQVLDPHNISITIRTGVTFTDGVPMTVDDVIFSFQTLGFNSQLSDTILKSVTWQDPPQFDRWNSSTPWGSTHKSHVGVVKTGPNTVRFQLRQDYSMFYFGTLTTPIMPAHIWQNHLVDVDIASGSFSLPGGAVLTQGTEFDLGNYGASSSEIQATIGTGPWALVRWTPGTSAELKVYDSYWGKSQSLTWQGKQWPFFPANLKKMQFKLYGTLDVAILALKSGEVHVVPWDLPPGFYNDLRRDPRMGFGISAADGFFYISFNMRKAPMNDLQFRRAVGYCIDKDFIVNRLLAGFGIKGEVPMSPINPAYINSSATTPPFDLAQAISILNAAGYTDTNGDGWREMPTGAPLKLSILTPAKDYDPVRADSGIMIANNLKSVGLNIDSAPTAFDAIVSAVFVAVQFDMYILGWVTLGPFPELYMFDFFGCNSMVETGQGDNTPGYCNSAVEDKLKILDSEMNDAARIQATKDIEGMLTRDLPYNTLYSKRWIEGYRQDIFGGWISVNGEIFNLFSIGVLGPPGGPSVPTGPLTVSLNGPGQVVGGSTVALHAYVVQGGAPAAGVDVNVTATTGEWTNATTGADGYAQVNFAMPYASGPVDFVAVAKASGGDTGGDVLRINVVLPNDISQVLLSTSTPVVAASGTATITAKVVDRAGNGIAGVPVDILPQLVLGNVTPAQGTTDSTGVTTFSYTAPPPTKITNRNQFDYIKATVDVPNRPKVPDTKTQTLVMGVENPDYDWQILEIQSVSAYVVDTNGGSPIPLTSDVTVKVTDQAGTAIVGADVTATISAPSAMSVDAPTKTTVAGGTATFTFTATTATSTPVSINFTVAMSYFAMSGLCLLVTDGSTTAYATKMDLTSKFVNPNTADSLTVTVYDNTGAAASGVEVDIFIPYNDQGNPVAVTLPEWTFIGSVGSVFANTTDVTGKITTSFGMKTFPSDNVVTLETGIAGYGPQGAFILGSPSTMYFYQHVIQKRNKLVAVSSFLMEDPILSAGNLATNVTIAYKSSTGVASGVAVSVYRGLGDLRPGRGATKIGDFVTDVAGQVKAPWTETSRETDTALGFTTVLTDTNYALGGQVGGVPFEMRFAYLVSPSNPTGLYPTGAPASTIVKVGNAQSYTITVKDYSGTAVQDVLVQAGVASGLHGTTTASGQVTLSAAPGTTAPTGTDVWETTFTLTKGSDTTTIQLGTLVGVGIAEYSNLVVPGSGKVGEAATISVDVRNAGPVADNLVVTLNVDGNAYASKVVTVNAGQTVTVSFPWVPSDTSAHSFSVGSLSGSLTAGGAAGGLDMMVGVALMIVLLIVGIVIGFFIGKMKKAPPAETQQVPPEPPKPPEGQI